MSAPKPYQHWIVARKLPHLEIVAEALIYSDSVRLTVEHHIEWLQGSNIETGFRRWFPGAIVSSEMRFGAKETTEQRDVRMLRAFLLLQGHLLPRGPDNEAAHDAVELAILELTRSST